jgi:hypothetical protein
MFAGGLHQNERSCFRTVPNIGSALVCNVPGWPALFECMLQCSCHKKSSLFLSSGWPQELWEEQNYGCIRNISLLLITIMMNLYGLRY